jgi:hypothetical protein
MGKPRQKIWYEEGLSTSTWGNKNYKDEDEYTEEK